MDVPLGLAAVLLLVAANGFFVATEFALVSVRRTRVEQLAAAGSATAKSVLDALNHLDTYIAATQLGITMASLALGWIGEPAFAHLIEPVIVAIPFLPAEGRSLASHAVSASIAFAIITALHIVLGELAPKSVALQRAEATALLVTRPIHLFLAIFRIPIMALNSVGNAVVRLFGIQPAAGHALVQSVEELKLSVSASRKAGLVNPAAEEIVDRALDFSELQAQHIMVPRPEIVGIPHGARMEEVVSLVQRHLHSRYPVYEDSLHNIVGVVAAKGLLAAVAEHRLSEGTFDVRQHMRAPLFVPKTVYAYQLLSQMRDQRHHCAIAVDEYGGTAGLVTLRDLIDHLAGELPDEMEPAVPEIVGQSDGSMLVDGLVPVSEIEQQLGVRLDDSEYHSLGGFVFGCLGRRPSIGDTISVGGRTLRVEELDGLRIARVRICPEERGRALDPTP